MEVLRAIGDVREECERIMATDGHYVPNVTHAVRFDGKTLGCFSVAPSLSFYMRPEKANAMHSYKAFMHALGMIRDKVEIPVLFIDKTSPYRGIIPKLGFQNVKDSEVAICVCKQSRQ